MPRHPAHPAPPAQPATSPASVSPTDDRLLLDEEEDARPRAVIVAVNDRYFAIPVTDAREIVRAPRLTRVPGAPPELRGVLNVRGTVVTVLDLGVMLDAGRAVTGTSVVLIENGSRTVGFAVDDVRDVRALDLTPDGLSAGFGVVLLDAAALCARYLISAEEMGR